LTFKEEGDYWKIEQGDEIEIDVEDLKKEILLINKTKNEKILLAGSMDEREQSVVRFGGTLPFIKEMRSKSPK
jgi:hypothetical protein